MNDLAPCDREVYAKGTLLFMTHSLGSAAAQAWVQKIADRSGQRVDWHYAAGRILIKALGDLDKVKTVIRELMPEHDAAYKAAWGEETVFPPRPAWWDDASIAELNLAPRVEVQDGELVLVDPLAVELIASAHNVNNSNKE
jgi:hypothetical protein